MRAIDALTAHYRANKRQHIDIPEVPIDGKPLRIFWDLPTLSLREKARVGVTNDAEFVGALAQNEDGSRMFDAEDVFKLRDGVDAAIVSRIALRMLSGAQVTEQLVADKEKN